MLLLLFKNTVIKLLLIQNILLCKYSKKIKSKSNTKNTHKKKHLKNNLILLIKKLFLF
jgi:hypothetical protein